MTRNDHRDTKIHDPACLGGPMPILFADLETTGLDPRRDLVLEVAFQVCDPKPPFKTLSSFERVVRYSWSDVKRLAPDVVWQMHEASGLLADLQHPDRSREAYQVWPQAAEFLTDVYKGPVPYIAGCGIDFDRRVLDYQYPSLGISVLGTKIIDVSSVRRVAWLWGIDLPEPAKHHRAMADIEAAKIQLIALVLEIKNLGFEAGFQAGLKEGVPGSKRES